MMKKTKLTIAAALFAGSTLLPLGVNADWILINDFEAYADGEDVADIYPSHVGGGSLPIYTVFSEDIANPDANKGFFLDWGTNTTGGSDTWMSIPFVDGAGAQVEIPEDTFVTIYYRIYSEGYSNKFHFGTTNKMGFTTDDPPVQYFLRGWGDHSTILRFTPGGLWGVHSGGYKDSTPGFLLNLNEWTEFWIVCRTSSNQSEKNWRVYYRRAGETEPTAMAVDPDAPTTLFNFRNTDNATLKAIVVSSNNDALAPNNRDFWLIDDIYYTEGEMNLGDPRTNEVVPYNFVTGLPGAADVMWGNYTVVVGDDGNNWVNTDTWMSWLNVQNTDETTGAGWVYCLSLDTWMFFGRAPAGTDTGSWVFAAK